MPSLPRLYAILDSAFLPVETSLFDYARELAQAGVTLMQYRNKSGNAREVLADARQLVYELRREFPGITLIMNDRPDLCLAAGFNGVHLGQEDIPVSAARKLCPPPLIVGISTHNVAQLEVADSSDADYIAFGPVFGTASKANPDPVVGLDGLRQARTRTKKSLVGIGGITLENCRSVLDAGADSIAVISALTRDPRNSAGAFFRVLG